MKQLGFILSTGRTGTQFFESYIQGTSDTLCLHEPKPSRRFKFLSNAYLNHKVSAETICSIFRMSRRSLDKKLKPGQQYIESNNFAFGCMNALEKCYPGIKILHIVRDPLDYVQSHLNHGFWIGHKKFFVKFVPYWFESVDGREEYRNDPVALLLLRWAYVNQVINEYENRNNYLRVKFEVLFHPDLDKRLNEINKIRHFFELGQIDPDLNSAYLSRKKNSSRRKISFQLHDNHRTILKSYKHLLKIYGYQIDNLIKEK